MAAATADRPWALVGENLPAGAGVLRQAGVDVRLPSGEAGLHHRDAMPRRVGTDGPDEMDGHGEDANRGRA
jgi:hypothetical protein